MSARTDVVVVAVVLCITLLLFVGGLAALLVAAHGRRVRHRAELAELRLRHAQAVMAAEREAVRHTLRALGRDLHDSAGQMLTVAQVGLNTLLAEGTADPRLVAVRDAVDRSVEEVRRLGRTLDADHLRHGDLHDAVVAEADRIERVARVGAQVLVTGALPALPPDTAIVLFRAFQEAVNNALKHSGADALRITLSPLGAHVRLQVSDNGRGFDFATVGHGAGLRNLAERCALVGYGAHCFTAPGAGCTWTFEPLDP